MAVFDRQAIQEKLLREDNERDIDFATAIGTLKAFSLITEEQIDGTLECINSYSFQCKDS
jgi:hypothetical protein